jgi:hypothetical protein
LRGGGGGGVLVVIKVEREGMITRMEDEANK